MNKIERQKIQQALNNSRQRHMFNIITSIRDLRMERPPKKTLKDRWNRWRFHWKHFAESLTESPYMIKGFYMQVALFFFDVTLVLTYVPRMRIAMIIQLGLVYFNLWMIRRTQINKRLRMIEWIEEDYKEETQ